MTTLAASCAAFAWLVWSAGALAAAPPVSPQTTFFHANALYKDGDYAAAVQEYEQLLRSGLESGNLYFNLGNAYFKAGDKGKAILNFERARRLMPTDPDLRANLAYAQSLTEASPCMPPLWQRVTFPLAHRMATNRFATIASASYTLLFAALIGYRLWPRRPRWLRYVTFALVAGVLVIATSLLHQVFAEDWQQQAVVIADGDTPTRFEPAPNGTVHFVLKQGALVHVTEARAEWLQVERCDGRRGWVARDAVEEL